LIVSFLCGTNLPPLILNTGLVSGAFFAGANTFLTSSGITFAGIYVIGPTLIVLILPDLEGVTGFNKSILFAGAV